MVSFYPFSGGCASHDPKFIFAFVHFLLDAKYQNALRDMYNVNKLGNAFQYEKITH